MRCSKCDAVFPVRDGIIEFVKADDLDEEKLRELKGNTFEMTPETLRQFAHKDEWGEYYTHLAGRRLRMVRDHLARTGCTRFVSLGSGTGAELAFLLSNSDFDLVLSSDLSFSMTRVVPHTLDRYDVKMGLFTSDLDRCPVRDTNIPILVYEALHHTGDMHASIEGLLRAGYQHIVFVEPSSNWLIRYLARRGLAQRVEYSGVKPGRLDIPRLRGMCASYGYELNIATMWHFPGDYFNKLCATSTALRKLFLLALDAFSAMTNPFRFGNMAVVYCRKRR